MIKDADKIFRSLDIKKNGQLDIHEIKVFMMDRYQFDPNNEVGLVQIFQKFDLNQNGTLEKDEFLYLSEAINNMIVKFSYDDLRYMEDYDNYSKPYTYAAMLCCICTLSTSWFCAGKCMESKTNAMLRYIDQTEYRLNQYICNELMKDSDGNNEETISVTI